MSDDTIWEQIQVDAADFEALTTEGGAELSELVRSLQEVEEKLSKVEKNLETLKSVRNKHRYDLIPNKMAEMNIDKVQVNGSEVTLRTLASGTMPKDPIAKENALAHLREIGAGDFIKNDVVVSFGVTQDNYAKSLAADLEDQGYETLSKTWVEPMTLKKIIKDRVEANQEIDLELFNGQLLTMANLKGNKNG
jgi:hypothetical protein